MAYKILKKDEGDFKKTLIEKNNVKINFTLEGADAKQDAYKRQETEWSAQVSLCQSVIDNVKRNHPDIFELPEEKRVACKLVLENQEMIDDITPKLEGLQEGIKKYEKEREEIMSKFNWKENDGGNDEGGAGDTGEPA